MGKKGKGKGKKGSGKKKKGGKKKKEETQMTWKEALLAYQINIKENQIDEVRFELKALNEKHGRHVERNDRLEHEQEFYMDALLKQAKEFEKFLDEEEPVEKNEVIQVVMDKWQAKTDQEKEVADLKEKIAHTEADIICEQNDVDYWTEYKDKGQHEHSKQIKLLEQELNDMESSFEDMKEYLEKSLAKDETEIDEDTHEKLELQKYLASEKAMAKMDKNSRQEILDNDWLKRETEIHRREVDELLEVVEAIEKENLQIMSTLFECTVEDLKISKSAFMTQFSGEENLDDPSILEMDLMKIDDSRNNTSDEIKSRPKSATARYIENKVLGLKVASSIVHNEEEEQDDESQYDGMNSAEQSEAGDPFNNFYHFDDEEFDDYLKLGPLELKLLSVRGSSMPVYRPKTPSAEEIQATFHKPEHWPVTKPMINKAVRSRRPVDVEE